jgi:hypothetical protein
MLLTRLTPVAPASPLVIGPQEPKVKQKSYWGP